MNKRAYPAQFNAQYYMWVTPVCFSAVDTHSNSPSGDSCCSIVPVNLR